MDKELEEIQSTPSLMFAMSFEILTDDEKKQLYIDISNMLGSTIKSTAGEQHAE